MPLNLENKKQVATLFLAIGLGLISAFLMSQHVKGSIETETKKIAAAYQAQTQTVVQELELTKRKVNQLYVKQQALEKIAKSGPAQDTRSSETIRPVVQMSAFSVRTPPGKRALTIMIDSLSAIGGLINPGDFVDVVAHLDVPKFADNVTQKDTVTTVLFQNVQVLSVGTNFKPVGNPPAYEAQAKARTLNVTLALDPEEVGLMTFAQNNGKLQLALRSPAEQDTKILEIASWESLSDYALERQGTKLPTPSKKVKEPLAFLDEKESEEEIVDYQPVIQLFKGGQQASF